MTCNLLTPTLVSKWLFGQRAITELGFVWADQMTVMSIDNDDSHTFGHDCPYSLRNNKCTGESAVKRLAEAARRTYKY